MQIRHKYNAKRTELRGRKYASKLEARYAALLHKWYEDKRIVGWLEQVPFHMTGATYQVDFLVFGHQHAEFVEIKGRPTPTWKRNMRQMAKEYPWADIEVLYAKDIQALEKEYG